MKTAGLRIRVEPDLRDLFVSACQANDLSAAQVLRAFMREYVSKNKSTLQGNLFDFINQIQKTSTIILEKNEKI